MMTKSSNLTVTQMAWNDRRMDTRILSSSVSAYRNHGLVGKLVAHIFLWDKSSMNILGGSSNGLEDNHCLEQHVYTVEKTAKYT